MKKKFLCFLTALSLLMASFQVAFADEPEIATTEESINVTNTQKYSTLNNTTNDYQINNMTFWRYDVQVGNPSDAHKVSVDITRIKEGNEIAKLIVASYTTDEKFIGISTMDFSIEYGMTAGIKLPIKKSETEDVGEVKIFIWNSFGGMKPVSNFITNRDEKTQFTDAESFLSMLDNGGIQLNTNIDIYENEILVENGSINFNMVGTVKLIDRYKSDGIYDEIHYTVCETAVLNCVDTENNTLEFHSCTNDVEILDLDKDNITYNIYYNDTIISLDDLQENDVLSIKYNTVAGFNNSDFYNIYVSRTVKTGKFTSRDTEERIVTIGGEEYSFASESDFLDSSLLASEITIYLDIFGRIALAVPVESECKYAIVDILIENTIGAYDDDRIRMFTDTGEVKTIVLESYAIVTIGGEVQTSNRSSIQERVGATMETRTPIQNRVVTYKCSSATGYIKELNFLDFDKKSVKSADKFNADTLKLGNIYLAEDTKIVDAVEYSEIYASGTENNNVSTVKQTDLKACSVSDFGDGIGYTAYSFDKREDGTDGFVIVTDSESDYNKETRFAVVASLTSEGTDETTGETIYTVKIEGQEEPLIIPEDAVVGEGNRFNASTLNIGDVIVCSKNKYNYVDDIQILFNTYTQGTTFTALADSVINGTASTQIPVGKTSDAWTTSWTDKPSADEEPIRVMVGIVTENTGSTITLVKADANKQTDTTKGAADGVYELLLTYDTSVYTYDYAKKAPSRVSEGLTDTIIPSALTQDDTCYADVDCKIIDWSLPKARKNIKLAVVKTLGDEAIDILYITGSYN